MGVIVYGDAEYTEGRGIDVVGLPVLQKRRPEGIYQAQRIQTSTEGPVFLEMKYQHALNKPYETGISE